MENFLKFILNDSVSPDDEKVIETYLDPLFDFSRDFVGNNLLLLNSARKKMRSGNPQMKIEAYNIYKEFQINCIRLVKEIEQIRDLKKKYRTDKCLAALESMILDSTKRKILTKLPSDLIDYLKVEGVTESDIDWIISKLKDYWSKFAQIYAISRLRYLLR